MNPSNVSPAGCVLVMLTLFGVGAAMGATPFDSATVTRLQNKATIAEVAAGKVAAAQPAAVTDVIHANKFLQTAGDARAEMEFKDKSLTRLGPNAIFSFDAQSRTLSLEKGDMLFYLPPGAGGVKIKTAALTAALTGTVVLMSETGILALDGKVTITYVEDGEKKTVKIEAGTDHNAAKMVNHKLIVYKSGSDDEMWITTRRNLLSWAPLPDDAEIKIALSSPWASDETIFDADRGGGFVSAGMNLGGSGTVTKALPSGQVGIFDLIGNLLGLRQ